MKWVVVDTVSFMFKSDTCSLNVYGYTLNKLSRLKIRKFACVYGR